MTHKLIKLKFDEARGRIKSGDTLLFRRRGLVSIAGRGEYCHAAKAAWWDDDLFCLEVREWFGGRAVILSSQIPHYPAGIDVFRPFYLRDQVKGSHKIANRAVAAMRKKTGKRYAWWKIASAALLHLPFARLCVLPCTDRDPAEETNLPEFCSEAVANADHQACGIDPVPHLCDRQTEPSDLARTTFYEYQFTVVI